MQPYEIYELTPDTPVTHLALADFVDRVGLVVHEGHAIDSRSIIASLPVRCAALALVTNKRLRPHRRLAACVALSRQHGCPCHVFSTPEQARAWLMRQMGG